MTPPVTGRLLPPSHGRLRSVVLLAGLVLGGLLQAGCSTPAGTGQPEAGAGQSQTSPAKPMEAGRPLKMVEARLDDKTTAKPNGRTSWSTTWRACFAPDPAGTTRMEAQAVTSEGSGTSLRQLEDRCLKLEVARGENDARAGMPGRDTQLAEAAALAYRVRAVHQDGTVTPWTAPIPAGSTKP
jgi:hypothetical protein